MCLSTRDREEKDRVARLRRRPLRDELGTVLTYPLKDPMAYVMMAVAVGVFGTAARYAAFGNMVGAFFYYALLYGYAFTAINRVSSGNTKDFMPDISDVGDLIKTVVLAIGAMIVSSGPMFVLLLVLGVSSIFAIGSLAGGGPRRRPSKTGPCPTSFATCCASRA